VGRCLNIGRQLILASALGKSAGAGKGICSRVDADERSVKHI